LQGGGDGGCGVAVAPDEVDCWCDGCGGEGAHCCLADARGAADKDCDWVGDLFCGEGGVGGADGGDLHHVGVVEICACSVGRLRLR